MIKVIIDNMFAREEKDFYKNHDPNDESYLDTLKEEMFYNLKPHNKEKIADGKIYEFENLKSVLKFVDEVSNELHWTKEFTSDDSKFNEWNWFNIEVEYSIESSEDNLIALHICGYEDYRE